MLTAALGALVNFGAELTEPSSLAPMTCVMTRPGDPLGRQLAAPKAVMAEVQARLRRTRIKRTTREYHMRADFAESEDGTLKGGPKIPKIQHKSQIKSRPTLKPTSWLNDGPVEWQPFF